MTTIDYYSIDQDYEEPYDWRFGPCPGITWLEWAKEQIGEDWIEEVDHNHNEEPLDNSNDIRLEEDELECPPTPRASHFSTKRQLFKDLDLENKKSKAVTFDFSTPNSSPTKIKCPDAPKKAKTRAERRAIDPESDHEDNFETPKKKERRTDYWVHQDDLRMKRARTLKTVPNEQIWSDEEEIC